MNFKKLTAFFCITCIVFFMTACAHNGLGDAESGILPDNTQWEADINNHWYLDEAGNKMCDNPHTLDDGVICAVCGAEIYVFDDEFSEVVFYNAYGDCARIISYGAKGEILHDTVYEYEYDENGLMLWQKLYTNGELVEEVYFAENDFGTNLYTKQTDYDEDGSYSISEYDENGSLVSQITYDPEDHVEVEIYYESAIRPDGEYYIAEKTTKWADGTMHVAQYNEYGDEVSLVEYDADGNAVVAFTASFEYNDNGQLIKEAHYIDGVVISTSEYAVTEDGNPYVCKDWEYMDDGSWVICVYDENGDLVEEIVYDADGNLLTE